MSQRWRDADVSTFDRLVWPDGAVEHLLATGERRRELTAYLGEQEYAELVPLARQAHRSRQDPARILYLVPGIMGSQLGVRRAGTLPANLLWIDPADFQAGALSVLGLPDGHIEPLGVVLYTYLRLKLHLLAAGYTVRCYDYDWRRSVHEVGAALAQRLQREEVAASGIVAHSMGGLVARAALRLLPDDHPARAICIATPHCGSYATVQALRGSYTTVRRIAQLDPHHTAEALAEQTFSSFPSLYEMLPGSDDEDGALDLYSMEGWPATGARPRAELLQTARARRFAPAPSDARMLSVVGVGSDTATSVEISQGEFVYCYTATGDGTVPSACATLPGMPAWEAAIPHSELPRDAGVAAAVVDLLERGSTTVLQAARSGSTDTSLPPLLVTDSQLQALHREKLDWARMLPEQRRVFLDSLNEPPSFARR